MKLDGRQVQQLCEALYSAFPSRASLAQMVRFQLNTNIEVIAGGETLADVTFNLVGWAEARGRVEELILKAREDNPGNPELAALARAVLPAPPSDPLPQEGVAVDRGVPNDWVDYEVFARVQTLAHAVCRVELRNNYGTGFLVGPDLLLTCHHVISDLVSARGDASSASGATLRFDFRNQRDKASNRGRACHLASDWLVAMSPSDELNFALMRLDDSPGNDAIPSAEPGATRGWVSLAEDVDAVPGDALVIIGHPMAAPLSVILATQQSLAERESLLYEGRRAPGLSGAPCFSRSMGFIAMHAGEFNPQSFTPGDRRIKRALLGRAITQQPAVRAILGKK